MSNQLPPNVRYVEESYAETWPTATQYGSIQFGPIKEGFNISLNSPMDMSKLATVEEQWAWIQGNSTEARNTLLTWSMRMGMERAGVLHRLKTDVIQRVNEALAKGLIRNAPWRDPKTHAVVQGPI